MDLIRLRRRWRLLVGALAIAGLLLLAPAPAASAQAADHCGPGQAPHFQLGFAALKARLDRSMGDPIECEHPNAANGDTLQHTTTGLAFYRNATNTPTFTDGHRHWALTQAGLVYWEGAEVDPPASAVRVPALPLDGFVRAVAPDLSAYWQRRLTGGGVPYTPAGLRWAAGDRETLTGCGRGRLIGPLYCGRDRTIYLEIAFFEHLWDLREDAAVVVVIAHEWGHHVQGLLGINRQGHSNLTLELQADCMAGMYFREAGAQGRLEDGDLDEAVRIALRSGDPPGTSDDHPAAHGSGPQRAAAFQHGYDGNSCFP